MIGFWGDCSKDCPGAGGGGGGGGKGRDSCDLSPELTGIPESGTYLPNLENCAKAPAGSNIEQYVVGGSDAEVGQFTFPVLVGVEEQFFCGGTLINKRSALKNEWYASCFN